MKPTHIVQIVLACIVAGGGAAVPLLVSPMTPTAWLLLAVAEAAAIGKVLSVQSEVAGDKAPPPDAVTKDASKIAPLGVLMLALSLGGCGWLAGNQTQVETDVGQAGACVLGQLLTGDENAVAIAAACAPATLADVAALIMSLLNYYESPPEAGPAPVAPPGLLAHLHAARASAQAHAAR